MISFARSNFFEVAEFGLEESMPVLAPGTFVCWLDKKFSFNSIEGAPLLGVVLTERTSYPHNKGNRHIIVATDGIISTANYDAGIDIAAEEYFIEDGMLTHRTTEPATPVDVAILGEPSPNNPYLKIGFKRDASLEDDLYKYAVVETSEPDAE